ncbi:MAG: hypothetical protein A3K19_01875 [Lentisphaerae bacterium RIFOXYB12_FULL_65_16]|nr:MAG: hypothetical protein A3K18_29520 [Lentisphaerae bacterium RIFOXYA12_64_32]OGV92626.1 MAG: hypothetical protein A3K19_01875 [Lentisphaerae bacterium RIFOXYB12_FULL_65_16]
MDVLVVGAGAVGTFYGAKLAQSGARVSLLCRSDYAHVREHGVHIRSVWGDFDFQPESVVRTCSEFAQSGRRADVLLVALKVLPDIDVVGTIRPAVAPGQTSILLLQNGIDIEPPVAAAFPENRVVSGLAFTCINRAGPGCVEHIDYGRVTLGDYPAGISDVTRRLGALFEAGGVPLHLSKDIVRARWLKLVWNAPFNPLSALCGGCTTREIMDCPEPAALARRVMEEVLAVAAAVGYPLDAEAIERNLNDTAEMKPYRTSMCLDLMAGRPLEVEAILGNAVRLARAKGVPVPHLETLYALLLQVDQRIRGAAAG